MDGTILLTSLLGFGCAIFSAINMRDVIIAGEVTRVGRFQMLYTREGTPGRFWAVVFAYGLLIAIGLCLGVWFLLVWLLGWPIRP